MWVGVGAVHGEFMSGSCGGHEPRLTDF